MFVVRDVVQRWEAQSEPSRSLAAAVKQAQSHHDSYKNSRASSRGSDWGLPGKKGNGFLKDLFELQSFGEVEGKTARMHTLEERKRLEGVAKALARID